VPIPREILDLPVFKKHELLQVYLYCILTANRNPQQKQIGRKAATLPPGSFTAGRKQVAAALGITPDQARHRLDAIEKLGLIATNPEEILATNRSSKFRVICVKNPGVFGFGPPQSPELLLATLQEVPSSKGNPLNTEKDYGDPGPEKGEEGKDPGNIDAEFLRAYRARDWRAVVADLDWPES